MKLTWIALPVARPAVLRKERYTCIVIALGFDPSYEFDVDGDDLEPRYALVLMEYEDDPGRFAMAVEIGHLTFTGD